MPKDILRRKYTVREDGFYGELFMPEDAHILAVVLSDNLTWSPQPEQIASQMSEYGLGALAVRLWGTVDQCRYPDRVQGERLEAAVRRMRVLPGVERICMYGVSLGTLYALLAAVHIPEVTGCALVSPLWSAFEGITENRQMSGHSAVIWNKQELPFVRADLAVKHGLWTADEKRFYDELSRQWNDPPMARAADLHPERIVSQGKSLLMIAGSQDRYWPAGQVAEAYAKRMEGYDGMGSFTWRIFPRCGHVLGLLPEYTKSSLFWRFYEAHETMTGKSMDTIRRQELEMEDSGRMVLQWLLQQG